MCLWTTIFTMTFLEKYYMKMVEVCKGLSHFVGFMAIRHEALGSLFIRALVKALQEHAGHWDIPSIFDQQVRVDNNLILLKKADNFFLFEQG